MQRKSLMLALFTLLIAAGLAACDSNGKMDWGSMGQKSLYQRLGGQPAIDAVCEDFVGRAASDPAVDFFRKNTPGARQWNPTPEELAMFKKHLKEFVAMAAGGPVKYEGRDMKTVHQGMKITSTQFDALAADLSASLDKFNVAAREKGELLAAIARTKHDIVEMP